MFMQIREPPQTQKQIRKIPQKINPTMLKFSFLKWVANSSAIAS
jgi:hypothetical protein